MPRRPVRLILAFLLLAGGFYIAGAQEEEPTLSLMAVNIEQYRDREITMRLKLKHVDAVFDKIVFYDSNNHDIVFDISDRKKKKALRDQLLTIHEGMDYLVTFRVQEKGALDMIVAELVDFKPVIMSHIPE